MRIIHFLLFISLVFCMTPVAESQDASSALTLQDCYQLALKQSETVAIRSQEIEAAEARFLQALSTALPQAHFVYTDARQDGGGTSSFSESPEHRFTISQPLFSGFKEFAAMSSGKAETRQRKFEKSRAEELLFIDVVNAFYLYLAYQEEIKVMESIRQALLDRVEELKKREELGRSRPSEGASVEARLGRVEADLELIKGDGEAARQLLEFLTGAEVDVLADDPNIPEFSLAEEKIEQEAENRDDVRAAEEAWARTKSNVNVARAEFWPTVSLDGNYYTKREGSSSDVDWDVLLTAEVPIFEGGENIGIFKEAKALRHQAELTYQKTKRIAVLEIRNALTRWESSVRRFAALKKALAATEKNYELQQEDYRLNLVNNLDVLQALEDAENIRRDFISIQSETKRDYWDLKVALGEIDKAGP